MGIQNFVAALFLFFGGWLFWDEIQTRRAANPIHFLHQQYRRKKIARLLSRVQWLEHEHVVAMLYPNPTLEALRLSGQNWRGSGMTIKSATFLSNSPNTIAVCWIYNKPIPAAGLYVPAWAHFTVRGDLKGITLKQFRDNWSEFRLVLLTDKGEFTEHFPRPEIEAILYGEVVGQWSA